MCQHISDEASEFGTAPKLQRCVSAPTWLIGKINWKHGRALKGKEQPWRGPTGCLESHCASTCWSIDKFQAKIYLISRYTFSKISVLKIHIRSALHEDKEKVSASSYYSASSTPCLAGAPQRQGLISRFCFVWKSNKGKGTHPRNPLSAFDLITPVLQLSELHGDWLVDPCCVTIYKRAHDDAKWDSGVIQSWQ